ncbi:MAG: carboxypeptidase-like regulatory domain-containing protein [Psychroflexus sp.]
MKVFISIFLFFVIHLSFGQNIQGEVKDENGQVLSGASIYFDASTLGTITDENGKFKLQKPEAQYAKLVISFLGFETMIISKPKSTVFYKVILQPSDQQLDEVLVQAPPFTRKAMMKVFRREFLGETRAGSRSEILNEDVIFFKFNLETNTLFGYSREPIQVSNPYLAYNITFDLVEFMAEFNLKTLSKNYMKKSFFAGTSYFENVSENKNRFFRRRKKAYLGSSLHFFRALAQRKLKAEEFSIFHKGFFIKPDDVFKIEQQDNIFEIQILGNDFAEMKIFGLNTKKKFRKQISVLYEENRNKQTEIVFTKKSFKVDFQGNYDEIHSISFIGEMSKAKLGEMLPLNYRLK